MINGKEAVLHKVPILTVLMPVYNGEKYLRGAIESILNQTFRDFEFIIINDASTDGSRNIVQSYNDPRVRLIDNEVNLGLTRSLNKGLALGRGELVARMDADDVSAASRFQAQVEHFEEHPACGILFTGCSTTLGHINIPPSDIRDQKWATLFSNPMDHSTVMFRKEAIEHLGGYREKYPAAEDYDLWIRALAEGIQLGVLPAILQTRRIHVNSVSSIFAKKQSESVEKLSCHEIQKVCPQISTRMAQAIFRVWNQRRNVSELLKSPSDAWRLRNAIKNLIGGFAAQQGLGREWPESQALEFARRAAVDIWHALPRSYRFALLYEFLGCLTIDIQRPGFWWSLLKVLFKQYLRSLRRRWQKTM